MSQYLYFITTENIILGKSVFNKERYDKLKWYQLLRYKISKKYRQTFEDVKPIKCKYQKD